MNGIAREFVNERGNRIRMEAALSPAGVTVRAVSPSSECEHTWTIEEARTLHKLLASALWETFHG